MCILACLYRSQLGQNTVDLQTAVNEGQKEQEDVYKRQYLQGLATAEWYEKNMTS